MVENLNLRPINFKKDYEKLIEFYRLVFSDELSRMGTDVKEIFNDLKPALFLIKIAGIFSKSFKNSYLGGYVYENYKEEIIAAVNASTFGNMGKKWEISMVGTHPNYRRQGLAKKLVEKSIEYGKNHGAEIFILDVISTNTPAYTLYRNLGFTHFDSFTKLRLRTEVDKLREFQLPKGYTLSKIKWDKSTYKSRYTLDLKETPMEVQLFQPIDLNKYKPSRVKNILRPIFSRLTKKKVGFYSVHYKDDLVGTIFLSIGQNAETISRVELIIDPTHKDHITEPMIIYFLNKIKETNRTDINLLIDVRSSSIILINLLKKYNFEEYEKNHVLALKQTNY